MSIPFRISSFTPSRHKQSDQATQAIINMRRPPVYTHAAALKTVHYNVFKPLTTQPSSQHLTDRPFIGAPRLIGRDLSGAWFDDGIGPGGIRSTEHTAKQLDGTFLHAVDVGFDTFPTEAVLQRTALAMVDQAVQAGALPQSFREPTTRALIQDLTLMLDAAHRRGDLGGIHFAARYALLPGSMTHCGISKNTAVLQQAVLMQRNRPDITSQGPDLEASLMNVGQLPELARLVKSASHRPEDVAKFLLTRNDLAPVRELNGPQQPMRALARNFIDYARYFYGDSDGQSRTPRPRAPTTFDAYHAQPGREPNPGSKLHTLLKHAARHWDTRVSAQTAAYQFHKIAEAYRSAIEGESGVKFRPGRHAPSAPSHAPRSSDVTKSVEQHSARTTLDPAHVRARVQPRASQQSAPRVTTSRHVDDRPWPSAPPRSPSDHIYETIDFEDDHKDDWIRTRL